MTTKNKNSATSKECLYCKVNGDNPKITDKYFIVALEVPYRNLYFHRECIEKIQDLELFLLENKEIWYN